MLLSKDRNRKYSSIIFSAFIFLTSCSQNSIKSSPEAIDKLNQESYEFAKQDLNTNLNIALPKKLQALNKNWEVTLQAYSKGEMLFNVDASGKNLALAIQAACDKVKNHDLKNNTDLRLWMSASEQSGKSFKWVEYQEHALEIVENDLVAVRKLDKDLIHKKILASKDYLLRSMNHKYHAFYRLYKAKDDIPDARLRTIYSASSLWTLMKMYDLSNDQEIARRIPHIANFILSMQVKSGPQKGAFHHSISSRTGKKEDFYVVGTASKTIFTLLELSRRFEDKKYLDAAKNAGDWLLRKQRPDGTISAYDLIKNHKLTKGSKYSTLYHGQVLSALSRLYRATNETKYLEGAKKLAALIQAHALRDEYYLQDDYRQSDDPVPTAWGIMSLMDFHKAQASEQVKDHIFKLFKELVSHQLVNQEQIGNYGRYPGTFGTSGNGWISEVYSELYLYGTKSGWDPELMSEIKKSIAMISRWLIQNSYSAENTYFLKNPQKADGGLIRYSTTEEVRTDAVCHGVNSLLYMLPTWPEGTILEVPSRQR